MVRGKETKSTITEKGAAGGDLQTVEREEERENSRMHNEMERSIGRRREKVDRELCILIELC